jgi:surface polysaccharide O-acyltransferase-like enzyme
MKGLRTAAIVAALAAIVAFVPQGGSTAGFVYAVLSITLMTLFVLFGGRMYRTFRSEIYGLGDSYRAVLYASLGGFVLAMAWRIKLVETTGGTLLFVAMISAVLGGLYAVFLRWRSYRV